MLDTRNFPDKVMQSTHQVELSQREPKHAQPGITILHAKSKAKLSYQNQTCYSVTTKVRLVRSVLQCQIQRRWIQS